MATQLVRITLIVLLLPLAVASAGPLDGADGAEDARDRARVFSLFSGQSDSSAFLGVSTEEETEHAEGGARVTRVVDDSPAERAGVRRGDIIVGFDGAVIRGPVALTKRIREADPGAEVTVTVLRDGKRRKLEVELADRSDRLQVFTLPGLAGQGRVKALAPRIFENGEWSGQWGVTPDDLFSGRPILGVQLVEMTGELREHLGAGEDAGVLVSKVLRDTPAEQAEIRVGDLIVAIEGRPIADVTDIRRALHDREGETISVDLIRDRRELTLEVSIPERGRDDRPTGPRARWVVPDAPVAPWVPRAVSPPVAPDAPRWRVRRGAVEL